MYDVHISSSAFDVVWQGSSLGSYTTQWINEFHWSARGESAEDWLDESKKRREKVPYPPVKVIFPTKKTVQESALGEQVYRESRSLQDFSDRNAHNQGRGNNILSPKSVGREEFPTRTIL